MPEQTNISQVNNQRIAKNTILLYFRTLFILLISLYTSRVILAQLGVEDYGIYNVVGGVVGMFAVISSALSSSISRFITFELGRGDTSKLKIIFSTSVNIQIGISIIVLFLCEAIGVWFLNCKMTIPEGRMVAANWVLQCSLLGFCVNLISVPYNACIIAHEKMSAFAYISILEAGLKLAVCYMLNIASADRLATYAVLMLAVAIVIRITYGIYCGHHFSESHYKFVLDKSVLKEMTGFAGWSFFTNTAWIFSTQGVNLLVNVFFGVTLNAARGIASQVEGAVLQFVNNFTTAINPQITKSYASGQNQEMFALVCRGAKFSYLMFLIIAVPILMETEFLLNVWLRDVPDYAVLFARLSLISSMVNIVGNSSYTACMATGQLKLYAICVTIVALLTFPISWLAFYSGMSAASAYVVFILVYVCVDATRLLVMRIQLSFPVSLFIKSVVAPILITTLVSIIFPLLIVIKIPSSSYRFIISSVVSVMSVGLTSYFIGLTKHERGIITSKLIVKSKTRRY